MSRKVFHLPPTIEGNEEAWCSEMVRICEAVQAGETDLVVYSHQVRKDEDATLGMVLGMEPTEFYEVVGSTEGATMMFPKLMALRSVCAFLPAVAE